MFPNQSQAPHQLITDFVKICFYKKLVVQHASFLPDTSDIDPPYTLFQLRVFISGYFDIPCLLNIIILFWLSFHCQYSILTIYVCKHIYSYSHVETPIPFSIIIVTISQEISYCFINFNTTIFTKSIWLIYLFKLLLTEWQFKIVHGQVHRIKSINSRESHRNLSVWNFSALLLVIT